MCGVPQGPLYTCSGKLHIGMYMYDWLELATDLKAWIKVNFEFEFLNLAAKNDFYSALA